MTNNPIKSSPIGGGGENMASLDESAMRGTNSLAFGNAPQSGKEVK